MGLEYRVGLVSNIKSEQNVVIKNTKIGRGAYILTKLAGRWVELKTQSLSFDVTLVGS